MILRLNSFFIEIENLFIIVLISFFFSDKIKLFLTSYFVCYLFIVFHELSHIIFASIFGKKIRKLKLSIAGVCVVFNNNDELKIIKKLIIYIAGPLANIILALLFINIDFVFEVNIFLAFLNLMPVYPLDGYNIFKCILIFFNKINYLKSIESIFLILFFIISIIIFFMYYNPSLIIFFIYVILIKYFTKNHIK